MMTKKFCFPLLYSFVVTLISQSISAPLPKHWHESGGFGTDIQGGLGGTVIKVTNLNKDGPGSLREAVDASGPRLIVFEVGGVINLEDGVLSILNGQATIAGQTAPSPGISLIRANLRVRASDVVVSHLTVMLGDQVNKDPDCVNIENKDIVLNHVSVYWSKDENLSMGGPNNVTIYKCLIGEGLQYAGHPDGEHSKGSLITSPQKLSMIGCLYAHNAMRNPRVGGGEIIISNSVVYDWATGWDHRPEWFNFVVSASSTNITFVGNVGLQGPESIGEFFLDGHIDKKASAYMKDNIIIDTSGKDLHVYDPKNIVLLNDPPLWSDNLNPLPAHENLYEVLRTAGSRPGDRDFHNARIVRTVADGNGELIDSQDEVGGYPDYTATSRPIEVPDGVTARRSWLDSLEDEIAVDTEIDLSRLYNLVGSQTSDKLRSSTNVVNTLKTGTYKVKIVQINTVAKQLQVRFSLMATGSAGIEVVDLLGNTVMKRPKQYFQAGSHVLKVNLRHVSPGIYSCLFRIGNTVHNHMVNIM